MKIAPLYHALKKEDRATLVIVHTGQHYDLNMSDVFFKDLGLPEPDLHLGIGSDTHAEQTGHVMIAYEKVLLEKLPDIVVVEDVNSTVACALAACKIVYPKTGNKQRLLVAHLETGLRSFDRSMPEEINRLLTDSLADILWTPSPDAAENLIREGIAQEKIHRVGNIMTDSLEILRDKIENQVVYKDFGLERSAYDLVPLHRPSNVDGHEALESICYEFIGVAQKIPLIFPVHTRTRKNLHQKGLMASFNKSPGLYRVEPLCYIRFINLVFHCRFAFTDSGGIQEETTYLGIPP